MKAKVCLSMKSGISNGSVHLLPQYGQKGRVLMVMGSHFLGLKISDTPEVGYNVGCTSPKYIV